MHDDLATAPLFAIFHVGSAGSTSPEPHVAAFAALPGTWTGTGLDVLFRPGADPSGAPSLRVTSTVESLAFAPVTTQIPADRAGAPPIDCHGVQYVHQVDHAVSGERLRSVTGAWLMLPLGASTLGSGMLRRLQPRGDRAGRAEGSAVTVDRSVLIPAVTLAMLDDATGMPAPADERTRAATRLPAGVSADVLEDPNTFLREQLEPAHVSQTTILTVTARRDVNASASAAEQLARVTPREPPSLLATYWLETLASGDPTTSSFLQLQHSQRTLLQIGGVAWPHVSVATFRKRLQRREARPRHPGSRPVRPCC